MNEEERIKWLVSIVECMFSTDRSQEEIQSAMNELFIWQNDENAIEDCIFVFSNYEENGIYQKVLFVSLKSVQQAVRNMNDNITVGVLNVLVEKIRLLLKQLPNNLDYICTNYSLILLADLFTIKGEFQKEIVDEFPIDYQCRFYAILFEETQELFVKKMKTDVLIQDELMEFGLNFLQVTELSNDWLRLLKSLINNKKYFSYVSLFYDKLKETLNNVEMIQNTIDIFISILSKTKFDSVFLFNFIDYAIWYIDQTKVFITSQEIANFLLLQFWLSFFELEDSDLYCDFFVILIKRSMNEFFSCCQIFSYDQDNWRMIYSSMIHFIIPFLNSRNEFLEIFPLLIDLVFHGIDCGFQISIFEEPINEIANEIPEILMLFLNNIQKLSYHHVVLATYSLIILDKEYIDYLNNYIISNILPSNVVINFIFNCCKKKKINVSYITNYIDLIIKFYYEIPDESSKTFYMLSRNYHSFINSNSIIKFIQILTLNNEFDFINSIPGIIYMLLNDSYLNIEICENIEMILINSLNDVCSKDIEKIEYYLNIINVMIRNFPYKNNPFLMNFYSHFFNSYLSILTTLSNITNPSIQKYLCLIYASVYTKKLFDNSEFFINLIEELTKFNLLSSYHFMIIRYFQIEQLPNLRNFLLNTDIPEDSNLFPGIVVYMKYISENQIDDFWEIFSTNLLYKSIYRNDCFTNVTSILSNLVCTKQSTSFLFEMSKHLLNASIHTNNIQFPKAITIILIFVAKQTGIERFSQFFYQLYPNNCQEATNYFNLISNGDQFNENIDFVSNQFVKFIKNQT